ncbi:MAG: beta strand repeat-containing protein [Hyphomicrobiales bacterium]
MTLVRPGKSSHWRLALLVLAVAAFAASLAALRSHDAGAITNDDDVQFTVTQSPPAPTFVQPGSDLILTVDGLVSPTSPSYSPLYFEFDMPAGLSFTSGGSSTGVTCAALPPPSSSVIRCDYGNVFPGPLVQLTLSFKVTGNTTTDAARTRMRAGPGDGAPDDATAGTGDAFVGAGAITVFDVPANITLADSASPSLVFEGGQSTYTATFTNTTGIATGTFSTAIAFTNGTIVSTSCAAPGGTNGTSGGTGTSTAACSGSNIAAGPGSTFTMTVLVAANDTSNGAIITPDITATGLGLAPGDFTEKTIAVNEVGLVNTGASPGIGVPVNVCTATTTDIAGQSAGGSAQPGDGTLLIGSPSTNYILQTGDFTVSGPATVTLSAATGCGANQSGVAFTPADPGSYVVTAHYNVGGTNSLTITVPGVSNPVPSVSSLSPNSAIAGGAGFTLTVNGSNFVASSVIQWNGADVPTTYVSPTQLTATIPASDITTAGSANVRVVSPSPGGGTSSQLPFAINNPLPTLTSVAPTSAIAGDPGFTLTVNGTGFIATSKVRWDGADLATTYVSATQLTASVPATNIATAGSHSVTVNTPAPGGGTSGSLAFAVNNPVPAITAIAPDNAPAGGAGATVTITGAGFFSGSKVQWNGSDRTTTFVSATELTVALTPADLAAEGVGNLVVVNPAPGGGSSAPMTFTVGAPEVIESDELAVTPPTGLVPRSRLTFTAAAGSLAPDSVSFVIQRDDGMYWNGDSAAWQEDPFENPATLIDTAWTLAITGEARRQFAGTTVTVTAHALAGTQPYVSAIAVQVPIR